MSYWYKGCALHGAHRIRASARTGARSRKAWPRWERACFSAGAIWAEVRPRPSGSSYMTVTKIGSYPNPPSPRGERVRRPSMDRSIVVTCSGCPPVAGWTRTAAQVKRAVR